MANQIAIDWPGLRAAAVALQSVRQVAMRAAALLPAGDRDAFVERVNKRAYRERWLEKAATLAKPRDNLGEKSLSKAVQNGSKVVADALADDNRKTKLGLSRGVRRAAEVIGDMDGAGVMAKSEDVRRVVSSAAQIHGWDQGKSAGVQFKLLQIGGTLTLVSEGQGVGDDVSE